MQPGAGSAGVQRWRSSIGVDWQVLGGSHLRTKIE